MKDGMDQEVQGIWTVSGRGLGTNEVYASSITQTSVIQNVR